MASTNPDSESIYDKTFGLYQCVAEDFIVFKCAPAIIYLIASLVIEIFLIFYLFENLKFKAKIWRQKNIIFGSLILGNLSYFVYNVARNITPLYFLQNFFISLQLSLIIYYFASKAFKIIQSDRTKQIVKGAFAVLVMYNVAILIYNFVQYVKNVQEQVCKSNSWTYIRAVELFLTLIFAGVGKYISNQMEEQLDKIKFFDKGSNNSGDMEPSSIPTPLLDNFDFQIKHKASMKRNICWKRRIVNALLFMDISRMLIIINLLSGIVINIKNLMFLYNGRDDCRIIPHDGGDSTNWRDYLEALVEFIIKVMTYFLPLVASIVVFRLRSEEKQTFSKEEYYEGGIYTTALGLKTRKHNWEDEDEDSKKTPSQNIHSNSSISLGLDRKSSRTSDKINVVEVKTKSINAIRAMSD